MLIIFLALWALIYVSGFVKCIIEYRQLYKCIKVLVLYITAYDHRSKRFPASDTDYKNELAKLLRYYPVINKYRKYPTLSYSISDEKIRANSEDLLNELTMIRNFKRHELLEVLHPLISLKVLAKLPATILGWMGIEPTKRIAVLVNSLSWVTAALFDLFAEEIKMLIIALVK